MEALQLAPFISHNHIHYSANFSSLAVAALPFLISPGGPILVLLSTLTREITRGV
jgi:hypothetical protein